MHNTNTYHFFLLSLLVAFGLVLAGTALYFSQIPLPKGPGIIREPEGEKPKNDLSPPAPPASAPLPQPPSAREEKNQNPTTRVVPMDTNEETRVYYTDQGFSPAGIFLAPKENHNGCIVRILNETEKPLRIRLSPHRPNDNWGSAYAPILPKNSALIDPRYRIEKIAFHNHENPAQEFSVILDPRCLP